MSKNRNLELAFLDVGQGDSVIVKTPNGGKILIDAGVDGRVLTSLGKVLNVYDNKIDLLIATHEDLDHIGGISFILDKYEVSSFLSSSENTPNENMSSLLKIINNKKIRILNGNVRSKIVTNDNVLIEKIYPTEDLNPEDANTESVVLKITYGKVCFILTGDLYKDAELALAKKYKENINCEVLKLGHHGSDTSSHPEFLKTVGPKVAIVSAGKNNKYGHPHKSVIEFLNAMKIKILETSIEGNITLVTDGLAIWKNRF